MKKEQTFISEETFNQISVDSNITKEDMDIINSKPRFPFFSTIWLYIWLFFNKIR